MKKAITLMLAFLLFNFLFLTGVAALNLFDFGGQRYEFGHFDEIVVQRANGAVPVNVWGWENKMTTVRAKTGGKVVEEHAGTADADALFSTSFTGLEPGVRYNFTYEIAGYNDGKPEKFATVLVEGDPVADSEPDQEVDLDTVAVTDDSDLSLNRRLGLRLDFLDDVPDWLQIFLCGGIILAVSGGGYYYIRSRSKGKKRG